MSKTNKQGGTKMFNKLFDTINPTYIKYVNELVESILNKGWQGAPILYHDSIGLITGSHRVVALQKIEEMYYNNELTEEQEEKIRKLADTEEYAYDVTDIIDKWMEENPNEDLRYDSLGKIFEGTEVEQWKEEISEW